MTTSNEGKSAMSANEYYTKHYKEVVINITDTFTFAEAYARYYAARNERTGEE